MAYGEFGKGNGDIDTSDIYEILRIFRERGSPRVRDNLSTARGRTASKKWGTNNCSYYYTYIDSGYNHIFFIAIRINYARTLSKTLMIKR